MKRSTITLLLGLAFAVFAPSAFSQCEPAGWSPLAPVPSYDYIANGLPSGSDCWGLTNASYVTGTTACGWTSSAFEFSYGGSLAQTVTIPSSDTNNHFALNYLLDFEDPHHVSYWDSISVYVYDATTNTYLSGDSYNGGMPDLDCSRRALATYNGSLAGHTLSIYFTGSSAFSDTHVRVRMINFWGWHS